METHTKRDYPRMRQVVDWSAAIWAGLIAGLIFLSLNLFFVPLIIGSNGWVIVRYTASVLLGQSILPPPATFDALALIVGLLVHFAISIGAALLIALVIHRGGLLMGIVAGTLLGLAIYLINYYTLTLIFPWFFALNHPIFALIHAIFGALVGGIYEALEVEVFVPVDAETGEGTW
jgi:hypothetical protein